LREFRSIEPISVNPAVSTACRGVCSALSARNRATIFAPTLFTAGISATEPLVLKQIFDALSGASVFADIAAGAVLLFLLVRS